MDAEEKIGVMVFGIAAVVGISIVFLVFASLVKYLTS